MKRKLAAAAFLLVGTLASRAAAAPYILDKAHTTISFKIRHIMSKVEGTFRDFDGTLDFDPAHPEKAGVQATIRTASVDTRVRPRDNNLRGANFFDVEKYPAMTYTSTAVKKTGEGEFEVDGILELHGIKRAVPLKVSYAGEGRMGGDVKAGFSAAARIKRSDFNMTWNKTLDDGGLFLGDDVEISIEVEADKAPPAGAKPAAGKAP